MQKVMPKSKYFLTERRLLTAPIVRAELIGFYHALLPRRHRSNWVKTSSRFEVRMRITAVSTSAYMRRNSRYISPMRILLPKAVETFVWCCPCYINGSIGKPHEP